MSKRSIRRIKPKLKLPRRRVYLDDVEIWRPVVGAKNYEVSSLGRVKSLARWVRTKGNSLRFVSSRILKQCKGRYYFYCMVFPRRPGGDFVQYYVADAFLGPRPTGLQVCHCNGNPLDNRVGNLRYDTPAGNGADTVRHGRSQRGVRNFHAKLSEEQVLEIVKLCKPWDARVGLLPLSKRYGVSTYIIGRILKGETWQFLTGIKNETRRD